MVRTRIPDTTATAVWEWFKKTFRRDPTKMSKKDAISAMDAHRKSLLKQGKGRSAKYKTVSRFVTRDGKAKGIWEQRLGLHSQMKQLRPVTQRSSSGKSYSRSYVKWSQSEIDTLKLNMNQKPSVIQGILSRKHNSVHTISSISSKKSRLK